MKILLRLPNWLGDVVMCTPAIESLKRSYPHARFTLVGPKNILPLFSRDSRIEKCISDESKHAKSRISWFYQTGKGLGVFDIAITFQNSFLSAFFLFATKSRKRIGYARELRSFLLTEHPKENKKQHQVLRYLDLIRPFCRDVVMELQITSPIHEKRDVCIINPGAAFGEAKRWSPHRFGEVAAQLADRFMIVIVGGKDERDIGAIVESYLKGRAALGYQNIMGETTLPELVDCIASAKLMITNDSGPMHLAAAFHVPTVALFGSTDDSETHAWHNPYYTVVKKELACRPCKQRTCPLGHHACMEEIGVDEVMRAANDVLALKC